ncbi:hypothetical protein DN412_42545 [Cupriavidus lacunae]|uniref:Uncharacterized protein n=1 Tax=Cupriavidus lacunae TaxID=2666307 RepID=A0A370MW27_9BURK|nr:hypothetical protein DN412_42545 [Cupriavidus lacunae]
MYGLTQRTVNLSTLNPSRRTTGDPRKSDNLLGDSWRRAVWRVTRVRRPHLCSMSFDYRDNVGIRWDGLTMSPYGGIAEALLPKLVRVLAEAFHRDGFEHEWTSPDEILVIDNWRVLHARPAIPASGVERELERVLVGDTLYA